MKPPMPASFGEIIGHQQSRSPNIGLGTKWIFVDKLEVVSTHTIGCAAEISDVILGQDTRMQDVMRQQRLRIK